MLPLPFGCVRGEPKIRLVTMLAFSRNISLCPLIHCKLLEVLRRAAKEGVELAILCGYGLGTKLTLGRHDVAPFNTQILKARQFSAGIATSCALLGPPHRPLKTQGLVWSASR
jgi:hypothetical protein